MSADAAARRAARGHWEVVVTRDAEHGDLDDDLYWLRVPIDERARLTWDLSRELYSLAALNQGVLDEEAGAFVNVDGGDLERRLPRAALVLTRR